MTRHLAQLNIGKLRGPSGDPAMAGFFDNLDRINAAAERMPGFVWRLKDESGNATNIPWVGDASLAVNLSVWESVEALEKFVWQTVHTKIYARKGEIQQSELELETALKMNPRDADAQQALETLRGISRQE